ncbi:hypothetical protein [Haloferax sp. YSSS75]|uniref:hypothetical protein n=1 Tax=Haloferax sp. YSSS75 TaxID=3388564 RepID=UPI00398C99E0
MSVDTGRLGGKLSSIDPVVAVSLPITIAPFGYLLGWSFGVHLFRSEAEAVLVTTVLLTSL